MKLDIYEKQTNTNTIITKTLPSELGFPTLRSGAFLNQNFNKQTSHE